MTDLHIHFHEPVGAGATLVVQVPSTGAIAAQINQLKELMTMKLSEVTAGLVSANAQLTKIHAETVALKQKVADLQTVIDSMGDEAPADLVEAFNAVKAQLQIVDDEVPDATA